MKYFAYQLVPIGTVQEVNDLKSKFTVMYMYLYINPIAKDADRPRLYFSL